MKTKTIILLFLVAFVACKPRNKLNTNEQQLTQQILSEEQEKESLNKTEALTESPTHGSKAIRLEEDRSVDPNNPPLLLDIAGTRNKLKQVKYSELGNSVRYIFLRHPIDSAFFKHGVSILYTKSNIITTTWRGIGRFDLKGQFIEMICRDGQKFETNQNGMQWSTPEIMDKYVGSQGDVSAVRDKIFYKYVNNPNEEAYLMEYDASSENRTLLMPDQNENNGMNGKGKIVANLPSGRRGGNIILFDENHWLTKQRKFQSSKSGIFMTIHSLTGDTVCSLKDHDPVTNFSSSVYRGVESGDNYKLNGKLHFRQNFNDTIYRFENTNRLVPIYVIDLGEKGVASSEEAITPKFDLKEKFVYKSIFETKGFLFFLYTQNYASPNNAKRGTLKYNRFVLDKNTGEQFHAYIDAEPYMPNKKMTWPAPPQKNIINDLDFGPACWPTSQTENGKVYYQISGKDLKEHVQKSKANATQINKEQLEDIAKNCTDDDVLIMIIE
jgi:protein associated with RNAse G/E